MAIYFKISYRFSWILICFCYVGDAFTQCSSRNFFGPNCDFECHCMNNEQCNSSTGNCPSGCDFAWVGPACQHRNIVPIGLDENYMVTRHQSNIEPQHKFAELAVDRDLSTCSYTNYANKTVGIPWWRLWLKDKHIISNISIVTDSEYLGYFKNFKVLVENTTSTYWEGFNSQEICYTHGDSAPRTTSIDVTCTHAIYGNQLRIQLAANGTQLVLCDVRIYGECNDGTFGRSCTERCSNHCQTICDNKNGSCAPCKPGWTGSRCNKECNNRTYGNDCKGFCSPFCKDNACNVTDGHCLNGCEDGYTGDLCNYKCSIGTFGFECASNCSKHCLNGSTCMHTNGYCINGCDTGWTGSTCINECQNGTYGFECALNCSEHCLNGSTCMNTNGFCIKGCDTGWAGHTCMNICPTGSWGSNCANTCVHCVEGMCGSTDGVCDRGCVAGVKNTPSCDEECDNGSYGINCSSTCSKNCKDVCRKQTGECEDCRSGWHGPKCTLECEDGRWGENCKRTCVTCRNEICNRITGACDRQCKPGFKETSYCDQECNDGWYGFNCSEECSLDCKNFTSCSKTDGSCSECKPGLQGKMCENVIKQPVTETAMVHISGGGVAGLAVAVILLIFLTAFVTAFVTRKLILSNHGNHNEFKNETVSYSNMLDVDTISNKTQESSLTEERENAYDTIIRKSGNEHTYE